MTTGHFITADKTSCDVCTDGQYQGSTNQHTCLDDCGAGNVISDDKSSCNNINECVNAPCGLGSTCSETSDNETFLPASHDAAIHTITVVG